MKELQKRLDEALENYDVKNDCLGIISSLLPKSFKNTSYSETVFLNKTPEEAKVMIQQARIELVDLTIVSLISAFENIIFNHDKSLFKKGTGQEKEKNIRSAIAHFQSEVPQKVFEDTLRLCDYRDWVAHGKRWDNPENVQTDPATAYQVLAKFLTKAKFCFFK